MIKKDFYTYKKQFDVLMGVKPEPNDHEKALMARAEKYIRTISWIPGLRMIAVVNSLSMYATHKNSDIDLFIITAKNRMWFVRFMITAIFAYSGVWRHGKDIAGNFCLSFFVEEDALDLSQIAIEDDIYLYFWFYYMKPILVVGDTWERFLRENACIQREETFPIIERSSYSFFGEVFAMIMNFCIRPFGEWKTRRSFLRKGEPSGVIIRKNILKFHDKDRREEIRDQILLADNPERHNAGFA